MFNREHKRLLTQLAIVAFSLLLASCSSGGDSTNSSSSAADTTGQIDGTDANPGTNTGTGSSDENQIEMPNLDPTAAVQPTNGYIGEDITLDGSASSDADGDAISFSWQLLESPPGSSLFEFDQATGQTYIFTPDVVGTYSIRLTVTDARGGSSIAEASIESTYKVDMLSYRPIDAEYSKTLDRIIMVSSVPNLVHIVNPANLEEQTIALNLTPTSVSVGPDGTKAAIGHDGWVSYVDLVSPSQLKTQAVSTNVLDVVLAANDYIYAFPNQDQWGSIYSINITSGLVTTDSDFAIYGGTVGKLHPGGNTMYGADNGLSPSDLHKFDISGGKATVLYDSPYHGDYDICGDLWFSEDGQRVFTKCANVFRTTDVRDSDMTYNGSFEGVAEIQSVAHSLVVGEIAVLPLNEWWDDESKDDTSLQLFNDEFLGFKKKIELPSILVGNNAFDATGEYIFYSSDGASKYTIVKADESSALLNDHAIWKVIE